MKFMITPARTLITVGVGLAAVGVVALPGPPNTPDPRLSTAIRPVTAPAEGAYWHTRSLEKSTHPRWFGSGSNRYQLEERQLSEIWILPDGRGWLGYRTLGVRPRSAADEKAWRRDGSPSTWTRTAEGQIVSLSIKPDKGRVVRMGRPAVLSLADQRLSYEELQRLPADPAGLRTWIEKAAQVWKVSEGAFDSYVAETLVQLLRRVPAPKEVRTAAYEALPTVPGVRVLGKIKDSQGRVGEGFSIDLPGRGTTLVTSQVIVDTDTMLLAQSVRTTIGGRLFRDETSTETLLQVGWTDNEPAVPALP